MAAIASLPTVLPGTVDALRSIDRVLDDVDTGDVVGVEAAGVVLGQVDRLIARLQAVRLSAVAEADRCRAADATGATGTSAWLASRSKADAAAAARDVRLASALDDGLAVTRQALADGELSAEHARVIATADSSCPRT
jgi:hypothetical protein